MKRREHSEQSDALLFLSGKKDTLSSNKLIVKKKQIIQLSVIKYFTSEKRPVSTMKAISIGLKI